MIKKINNNKIMMISHIADIDGLGSVILAKKYYNDKIDYILCDIGELNEILKEDYNDYDMVYICDLEIGSDAVKNISNNKGLDKKIKHFDHHTISIKNNIPNYINSKIYLHNRQTCGTELFYEYLLTLDNKINLNNKFYRRFVEAVRENDTWDFQEEKELGDNLVSIMNLLGPTSYIDFVLSLSYQDDFILPDTYINLLNNQEQIKQEYIDKCDKNIFITNYKGNKIAVSISEQYRSVLGDIICKRHQDIDYILIINFYRMSCSLRSIRDDIDLSKIAKLYHHNGGGHQKSAGFVIDKESINNLGNIITDYMNNLKE